MPLAESSNQLLEYHQWREDGKRVLLHTALDTLVSVLHHQSLQYLMYCLWPHLSSLIFCSPEHISPATPQ